MIEPDQDNLVLNWRRISGTKHSDAAKEKLRSSLPSLTEPLSSVTQKSSPPPGGTLHDFWSIGPYWWPDPAKPGGLPFIRRDGEYNPDYDSNRYDRARLHHFAKDVFNFALAGAILPDQRFADRAAAMLCAWFVEPGTRMNPNMLFAQSIPGVCSGRGIGLIDSKVLINVAEAALIARRSGTINAANWAKIVSWYRAFLEWMLTHPYGINERNEHNNHGTWCDAQLAAFALFTGQPDIAYEVLGAVGKRRIEPHIAADGRQPHELSRTRSFTYSCFNLEGLFALAWMGRHVGVDLWSYRTAAGASLQTAIDFLAPYAKASQSWSFPELPAPAGEIDARGRLYPLLLQAAAAFGSAKYSVFAAMCPAVVEDSISLY
ncbi:alginate lyase family protein [soil metagenome]